MICPNCNAQLGDTASFCPACGARIVKQEKTEKVQQPQQVQQQQDQQPAPPKKKKGGKIIAIIAAVLVVLAAIGIVAVMLLQPQDDGAKKDKDDKESVSSADSDDEDSDDEDSDDEESDDKDSDNEDSASSADSDEEEEEVVVLTGTDVFDGECYPEMLWGYYEMENYEYDGSFEATEEFRQDMKYTVIDMEYGEKELSVLPITVQFGKYTHFMGTFFYEGEYHYAYTQEGRAMFRKAYMEQYGDLTEEDFEKIEQIMDLMVAEVSLVYENGAIASAMCAYEIDDDTVSLYTVSIDEQYNITMSDEPILEWDFLHDGGKLMLACNGLMHNYYADGYKETDNSLTISGYALDEGNRYEDLDGFTMYQFGADDEVTVYADLSNGDSPIEPVMDLDKDTGEFTLSWEQCWTTRNGNTEKIDDPRTISGTIIPCTSYGFTDYTGFIMIIDGTQYRYLMSEGEYEERKYADLEGAENLTDSEIEDLNAKKRDIIAELEAAFKEEGLTVSIDRDSGRVIMDANVLFASDSHELSQEGKEYLDKFTDVYTSVVLGEEYSQYVTGIVVEGHTDTSGSYSYNQTLSQNRADVVSEHCAVRNSELANIIKAVGCSYDYPVYDEDGSVDMDASRRVTFRFILSGV